MFNKAYNHISERIDEVYKDLTKGKSAPMGGVAYLSLEDSEVMLGKVGQLLGSLIFTFKRNLIMLESSIMLCRR
jgi:chromosome segregation ATPase